MVLAVLPDTEVTVNHMERAYTQPNSASAQLGELLVALRHKPLPELPLPSCKHFTRTCTTCFPLAHLGPLNKAGLKPTGLVPNALRQMDVTYYAQFGKLKYVHVIIGTHSSFFFFFLDASAQIGEKAT